MRQKEREKCEKLELDESKVDEILKKLSEIKIADEVRVSYHDGFTYVKTRIKFEDINRIEIVKKICSIKTK